MRFRRRRRRPQLDLAALDRLAETISRAVALIEERLSPAPVPPAVERRLPVQLVIRRGPEPFAPEVEPDTELEQQASNPGPELEPELEPEPEPEPEPDPQAYAVPVPVPSLNGFVLFVPTAAGYRLVGTDGLTPERGERLRVEEEWYRVLRLGPSPLPGDLRRCVFLEHAVTLEA